jgi:hypothetical protein
MGATTASRAGSATVKASADPVHRLKSRLGGAAPALAETAEATPEPRPVPEPQRTTTPAEPSTLLLASAIYMTGSRGLQAGSRYGIAIAGDQLQILGPVDVDPAAVATVHSLAGVDATGLQGRLILTGGDGRRERLALVFMSVAGASAEAVADAIVAAADELRAGRP